MPEIPVTHNQFAYSVSEVSLALKRVVEDNFGQVRVRGEISGWRGAHSSGHAYFRLKDEKSVIEVVCWRGTMSKIAFRPEEGLEVIITGDITTYPGSSKYQIVVKEMEPAGAGALMALLEKRKAMLAAEGLFDEKRKKPLPFMPQVIGVITSPTGAVIRDILHRLKDRFPCHVIIWPVAVQGENAAKQIADAIAGFNNITGDARVRAGVLYDDPAGAPSNLMGARSEIGGSAPPLKRPDLIIVARGGGSLEDLWAFNEEIVVRAAAASHIPLISAVGHETDTTLIDYASDRRAPTPTAAAEMAVPVREELLLAIMENGTRLSSAMVRGMQARSELVKGLARGLPHPQRLLENAMQRFDDWSERLGTSMVSGLQTRQEALRGLMRGLPHPQRLLETAAQRLDGWSERLGAALPVLLAQKRQQLAVMSAKLQPRNLMEHLTRHTQDVASLGERMGRMILRATDDRRRKLEHVLDLLESLSPTRVLERGFVLVRDAEGKLLPRANLVKGASVLTLQFHDGTQTVRSD